MAAAAGGGGGPKRSVFAYGLAELFKFFASREESQVVVSELLVHEAPAVVEVLTRASATTGMNWRNEELFNLQRLQEVSTKLQVIRDGILVLLVENPLDIGVSFELRKFGWEVRRGAAYVLMGADSFRRVGNLLVRHANFVVRREGKTAEWLRERLDNLLVEVKNLLDLTVSVPIDLKKTAKGAGKPPSKKSSQKKKPAGKKAGDSGNDSAAGHDSGVPTDGDDEYDFTEEDYGDDQYDYTEDYGNDEYDYTEEDYGDDEYDFTEEDYGNEKGPAHGFGSGDDPVVDYLDGKVHGDGHEKFNGKGPDGDDVHEKMNGKGPSNDPDYGDGHEKFNGKGPGGDDVHEKMNGKGPSNDPDYGDGHEKFNGKGPGGDDVQEDMNGTGKFPDGGAYGFPTGEDHHDLVSSKKGSGDGHVDGDIARKSKGVGKLKKPSGNDKKKEKKSGVSTTG